MGLNLVIAALVVVLALLQVRLWVGDGGLVERWRLQEQIAAQAAENERLERRNRQLEAEVVDLKEGRELTAIEERARYELGMIRSGETFYLVVEDPAGAP